MAATVAELQALSARASALVAAGRWDEAEAVLAAILGRAPRHAETWSNLGMVRAKAGKSAPALEAFRKAVRLDSSLAAAQANLGILLLAAGRMDEALTHCRKAAAADPNSALAAKALADCLGRAGKLDEAEKAARKAIARDPEFFEAYNTLSSVLKTQGRLDEAIAACRTSLAISFNDTAARNLVMALAYDPACDAPTYFAAQRQWAVHQPAPMPPPVFDHSPDRALRIGYLSADLREHPVARNVIGLIERHDNAAFIPFAYSLGIGADAMTRRIQAACPGRFRDVGHLDLRAIAEIIRADAIDILVVLAGWTGDNRPAIAAFRPAPLQVSWHDLGSSGLDAMDAWITDAVLHPPEATRERFTEELLRLPCFYLHEVPPEAPDPGPLPAMQNGFITFGSFNNPAKINPATLAFWARVLRAVPGSRMLLKYRQTFADRGLQARIIQALGLDAGRVRFECGRLDRSGHLGLYNAVDIALDCFPFNGSTTTFEALFMGVPVVGPAGERFVARCGRTLLAQIGLAELAPGNEDEAVAQAVRLAGDQGALAALRADLRPRILTSRLVDGDTYARQFEAAMRGLWRRRCVQG